MIIFKCFNKGMDMRLTSASGQNKSQQGVSLVELLVAVVIGLLGTIVIFTVYKGADGFKRTTVGLGDAQLNGAVALFTLERYIRTSGSSLATSNEVTLGGSGIAVVRPNLLLGCPLFGFPVASVVTGPNGALTTPIAPVRIIDGSLLAGGAAGASDVIVIMSGNADVTTNPTAAGIISGGSVTIPNVDNVYGWREPSAGRLGDVALMVLATTDGTKRVSNIPCAARRISAISGNVIAPSTVKTGSGSFTLASGNPSATFTPDSNIHNLGPNPYFISIGVNAQQELVETNFTRMLIGESNTPDVRVIADGIISMQAQYGIDNFTPVAPTTASSDDNVDQWVEPTGIWANPTDVDDKRTPRLSGAIPAAAITRIKAIRIAVLARSAHFEPPNRNLATPVCEATPTRTTWPLLSAVAALNTGTEITSAPAKPASADSLPFVIASAPSNAADANWRCFRYRVFETTIPVINMIKSSL
jgi:type IV pilus assembly protein PilW